MNPTLIIINSADRTSGTGSDFQYNFQYKTDVEKFRINKITVPYSWYNVKAQSFEVSDGIVTLTKNLPAGSYTINSLQSELSALLPGITITYNSDTNKYTFTSASAFTLLFLTGPGYLANILQLESVPLTFSVSTGVINLNLTSGCFLKSSALSTYYSSIFAKKKDNVVLGIPIKVNSFNYIVFNNSSPTYFPIDEGSLYNLDFQLVDDYNEILDLNGQNIQIELEVYSKVQLF